MQSAPTNSSAMETKTSLSIETISLLALGLASIIIYKYMKKAAPLPLPPGPTSFPITGSLPQMLNNRPAFRWIRRTMRELGTEIACIRLGSVHVIPVSSPELAREFLKRQDAAFASRPASMSARLTSNGYLSTVLAPAGDQWRKMRRIMASEVLNAAMFKWQYERRCEEADHLVRYVYNQCGSPNKGPNKSGLVNVRQAARLYCGNVGRKMIFGKRFFGPGLDYGGPGIEEREHSDALFAILEYTFAFSIGDYIPWLQIFDLDGHKKIITKALDILKKYQDPEITKRVEMWRRGLKTKKEDILDVLICLKDSKNNPLLSIQEIKAQINEMFIGGVDTPSNAIEWAIAEMFNQPEILERAYKELDQVVGKDRLVQESDLPKLNYVKACLKESFRLHPVAAFNIPHVSTKDTVVGGYFIPKGSHVLVDRLGLGQNPRIWEDPLKFKPERHMNIPWNADKRRETGIAEKNSTTAYPGNPSEVMLTDPELHMLSFSTGRRGCPAIVLGSAITIIPLARLIHGFNWEATPNKPTIDLKESERNLRLAQPLVLRAVPRLEPQVYEQLSIE